MKLKDNLNNRKEIDWKNKQSTKIYKTKRSNICVTGISKGEEEYLWKNMVGGGEANF